MSMIERQCRLRRSTDRTLEAKPSVSEGRHRIPSPPLPAEAADGGNVDRVLFKNLVEMVPLVESLMTTEAKGARETPTFSAKKQRDLDNTQRNKQSDSCNGFTIETEKILRAQEELNVLREQINDLQRKILEKDEALKSAESEINQMKAAYISIDELRIQIAEKDSMVKSINSQLSNAKNSLADKQATLERLTWEAQMSNKKIEELQGERVSMDYEITKLMQIFEELFANHSSIHPDASLYSYSLEPLPVLSDMDDIASEKLEETRAAYVAAVAAAKENPTEELLARAAEARLHLQALVI
ncbi:hypothetical protein ZIOFF_070101 [Zingiber officinale]|uniref:Uncharacterized protein n=1 Tax=Zingiber officinale TaxID=94328 RepID=A0A8J5EDC7_ZINOF|nr:hypothetical protein ZIOFF_070101 [Zingiber officinale]